MDIFIQILVLFTLYGAIVCPGGNTRLCRLCDQTTDPTSCTHIIKCHGKCLTMVEHINGINYFSMGCVHLDNVEEHCINRHPHDHKVCKKCCDTDMCNEGLCAAYLPPPTTTAPPPTTPPTTAAPVTAPAMTTTLLCHNIESHDFQCSDMDQYNFCHDTSSLAHMIALEKCPLHCGLCRVGDPMPTLPTTTQKTTLPPATATSAKTTTLQQPMGRRQQLYNNFRKFFEK